MKQHDYSTLMATESLKKETRGRNSHFSFIGAGFANLICSCGSVTSQSAVISGGQSNKICGSFAGAIGGGNGNIIKASNSAIAGGSGNTVSAAYSSILGGNGNTVCSAHSVILGGSSNTISAAYTYAAVFGNGISAVASNTFHTGCINAVNTPSCATGPFPSGTIFFVPIGGTVPPWAIGTLYIA